MKQIACFILSLPLLAGTWTSGYIKVVEINEWCNRPAAADWRGVCGGPKPSSTTLVTDTDSRPNVSPSTQILEIGGPDAIYTVRRTGLDGGLHFRPNAVTQYEVDGKHMLIKFDSLVGSDVKHGHDKVDILEVRKR